MAEIDTLAKYVLTNSVLGSNALASTSMNDSVVVVPTTSDSAQLWYFVQTDDAEYYRLHTEQKGEFSALDVFNYNGKNVIDLHFYAVQAMTGQHWRPNLQDDGTVKISNQFTGPDMYLDIEEETLKPTLAARDSPGMHWTLSKVGSTPTASPTASASASGFTTLASVTATFTPTGTSTILPTASASDSSKGGLSAGVKGGIAAGAIIGVAILAVGAFFLWRSRNNEKRRQQMSLRPGLTGSNPVLNVPRRG
ncbi:hypothetical protein IQ07DRAFT_590840 [Pyrenochaeta sp. DS3sAY3a]|nr:hypothetical protein IQ07DRAFT_590840 [Pyrenochaeta sp. DS3sAY3a]